MKMKTRTKKQSASLFAKMLAVIVVLLALALGMVIAPSVMNATAGTFGGKYYADYASKDEAIAGAVEVNLDVAEQGSVLLKNDGTLPLAGSEYVSVFGETSKQLVGNIGSSNRGNSVDISDRGPIYDSLVDAGFRVNPILADYYSTRGGTSNIGKETTNFSPAVASSFSMYNNVGLIVLSRTAGEGADADMIINEKEDNEYKGEDMGWKHEALFRGTYGTSSYDDPLTGNDTLTLTGSEYDATKDEYKHYLQLTESEEELIEYVESKFKKVVVVINTSNAMELYNLREDDQINGILLMGRPGESGHYAVGKILNGTVNPSGKLVDEWNTDFTADPTWSNFAWGVQVGTENMYYVKNSSGNRVSSVDGVTWGTHQQKGYYGVDYEEDIYLGYSYWETYYNAKYEADGAAAANAWWEKAVTFPFGYGLSYTDFSLNIEDADIYATGNNGRVSGFDLSVSALETLFASSAGSPAAVKTLNIPVTVKNTGSVAGKEVVEIYVTAPYDSVTAPLQKSFVTLSGYAKTGMLKPGAEETVVVKVNVQDFASFDYNDANGNLNKGYELDKGDYVIRAMNTSHYDWTTDLTDTTDAYDEVGFTLSTVVKQDLDDFSDNEATALFSETFTYTAQTDASHDLKYNSLRTAAHSEDGASKMELVSRDNILTYTPAGPTEGDLTLKQAVVDNWNYWNTFSAADTTNDDWYKASVPSNWTQAAATKDGLNDILLSDMMGVPLHDSTTTSGFNAKWDSFMNQLSLAELKKIVERAGMWVTTAIPSIGKISTTQADSYNDVRTAGGTFLWTDSPTLSATWDVDLANRVGVVRGNIAIVQGWSGYGGKEMDTHRSPFSGRNYEYLSQDGIQGGYIAAAFTSGIESKGVTCYIKHFALNDMETCRDGMNNNSWLSEQAARQIYFKVFQMAMQEGGASASMTGFARFCGVPISMNNRMLEEMVCDEWGWEGFYITDGYSGVSTCTTMETMLRSYCVPLTLNSAVPAVKGEWDAVNKTITINGVASPTQYYYLRASAARILYADAKSNDVLNGHTLTSLTAADISATQGAEVSKDIGIAAAKLGTSTAVYKLSSGSLPAGVTISGSTISGTPTEAGTFTFSIAATIDGWITSSLASGLRTNYTMTVASAFALEEGSDAFDSAEIGEDFYSQIISATINTTTYTSVTYTVASGKLPEGITLSTGGLISGEPTELGTFAFTVNVAASKTSSGGWGPPSSTTTNYTYSGTIVVSGDAPVTPPDPVYLTQAEVQALIDAATSGISTGLTEAQVKAIVDAAEKGLTSAQVQTLIDAAIADVDTGCNSSVTVASGIFGFALLAFGASLVFVRKRKAKSD